MAQAAPGARAKASCGRVDNMLYYGIWTPREEHFYMYAVFEDGGRQYRVSEGESVLLERRPAEKGQTLEFDRVLLCSRDDGTRVGAPYLDGAKVIAQVQGQDVGPKLVVGKFRRRKRYRRSKKRMVIEEE